MLFDIYAHEAHHNVFENNITKTSILRINELKQIGLSQWLMS